MQTLAVHCTPSLSMSAGHQRHTTNCATLLSRAPSQPSATLRHPPRRITLTNVVYHRWHCCGGRGRWRLLPLAALAESRGDGAERTRGDRVAARPAKHRDYPADGADGDRTMVKCPLGSAPGLAPCASSARAWRLWVKIGISRVRRSGGSSHCFGGSSELPLSLISLPLTI